MCHILFVIALLSPILFLFLPFGEALAFNAVIWFLCLLLFWLFVKDRHRPATTGVEGMIGGVGTIISHEKGTTKVFYRGEIWDAMGADDIPVGASVTIKGLERMKLQVQENAGMKGHATP